MRLGGGVKMERRGGQSPRGGGGGGQRGEKEGMGKIVKPGDGQWREGS